MLETDVTAVAYEEIEPINPVNQAMKLAGGSLPGMALLLRIQYWAGRAGVERHGKMWIAKARETWIKETGMSRKQVVSALRILTELGVIETHQYPWGGKNILHTRLLKGQNTGEKKGIFKLTRSPKVVPECAPEGPLYNQGVSITEVEKKEINLFLDAGVNAIAETHEESEMTTVAELMQKGLKKPVSGKKENVTGLEYTWKEEVKEKFPDHPINLPKSTFIKLKWFLKACPHNVALRYLTYVIHRWGAFCATVQSDVGLKTVPAKPSVDFVAKYAAYAVSFAQKGLAVPAASVKSKIKIAHSSPKVKLSSLPANPKTEDMPTKAEALAILYGD